MVMFFAFSEMKLFSLHGLIAMLLLVAPNLVFARKEQHDRPDDVASCGAGVCLMEVVSRMILVILLIGVRMPRFSDGFAVAAGVVLLVYYGLWVRYFVGGCHYPDFYTKTFLKIPVPFAVCSIAYFGLLSIWLCNLYALILTGIFGIAHMMNALKAREDLLSR